jgi:TRAP-type C4-dicarboxylate transport system permease large subunit
VAITAVSAILAVSIPPGNLKEVWGGVLTVSIDGLFIAGVFLMFIVTAPSVFLALPRWFVPDFVK